MSLESQLAEIQSRTIERTRLEDLAETLRRVDASLEAVLQDQERDVASKAIRKAIRALELRARERACGRLIARLRMGMF